MPRTWIFVHSVLVVLAGTFAAPLFGQVAPGAPRTGSIWGTVRDQATEQPVASAEVRVREVGRTELSHADGQFHFDRLAPGSYTIVVQRLGYAPAERNVIVTAGDTARPVIPIRTSVIDIAGIVVTGVGTERSETQSYRPTSALSGAELRRKLSTSVAATVAGEPGISQRYNGPAAAQPVVRGLSGDRVLVLEDGQRTGDIATTSADHAVTIEPLTAERIEVVRGPAGLLYGSNALGGVVNVIREEVPRTLPERITGTVSAQAETVNNGLTGGLSALVPVASMVFRAELTGRTADDTQTPLGPLPTSDLNGYNAGVGASWIHGRGFLGGAVRDYWMRYGVPGTFNGELIPGGHEGGVEIELRRTVSRVEAGWFSGLGPLESLQADGTFTRYDQDEFELGGESGPLVGTRFRQFTGTGNLIARHRHEAGGVLNQGAFGLWMLSKEFSTAGGRTGSRPAQQLSVAGYAFEELDWNPFSLEVGARYDWTRVDPLDKRPGAIGDVRTRDFGALSGSVAALYRVLPGWTAGISVSRAFRTPTIEELFSNGPHLADYSYNIGNPDLDAEFGFGIDMFGRVALPRLNGQFSVFRNAINEYIYYAPTGQLDPRLGRFPIFRAEQSDAVLTGVEGRLQWELAPQWVVDGNASYVRGSRSENGGSEPLPAIPPLHGGISVRHDANWYFVGVGWEASAAQRREAPFEGETDAYSLVNATSGIRWTGFDRLHTLTLQVNNLLDTTWRDHLSRIKAVAPQPGRNIQILYRVGF